jgi:hypothetical protein
LFDTFIPFAWAHLLPLLVQDGFDHIYRAWPPQQGNVTAGDALFWENFASRIFDVVVENDLAVWPIDGNGCEYKRLSETHVVVQDDLGSDTLRVLRDAGLTITEFPRYIFDLLWAKGLGKKKLTPEIAHKELLVSGSTLRC